MRREVPRGVLVLYYYQTGPDPAWLQEQEDIRQNLLALVERLPGQLGFIMVSYYGLKGEEAQTFQAIGKQLEAWPKSSRFSGIGSTLLNNPN
jgi:hypothetical protein